MIVDTFRNFIEIMGLRKKEAELLKEIASENKRISVLADKRTAIKQEIESLKDEQRQLKIKEMELETNALTIKLNRFKDQINLVKNDKELQSITHEVSHHENLINELETKYFSALERSEQIDGIIKDHEGFLSGSESTLKEIESEVNGANQVHYNEIKNLNNRIQALLESEKPANQKLYLEIEKKFASTSPFSYLNGKNCQTCRISIDVQTANNIEYCRSLEFCPNCGRLLLPININH